MKELFALIAHLLTTLIKLARPGGVRAVAAESVASRVSRQSSEAAVADGRHCR